MTRNRQRPCSRRVSRKLIRSQVLASAQCASSTTSTTGPWVATSSTRARTASKTSTRSRPSEWFVGGRGMAQPAERGAQGGQRFVELGRRPVPASPRTGGRASSSRRSPGSARRGGASPDRRVRPGPRSPAGSCRPLRHRRAAPSGCRRRHRGAWPRALLHARRCSRSCPGPSAHRPSSRTAGTPAPPAAVATLGIQGCTHGECIRGSVGASPATCTALRVRRTSGSSPVLGR